MNIRNVLESDYIPIVAVIDEWWGGRKMADMLPKLFFQHFTHTSFIVEQGKERIGFLIGFVSQTDMNQAYIHFVGVHPSYRKATIATQLYEKFFDKVRELGCTEVRCVTSPVNRTSIAFHTRLGFRMEAGDRLVDGISVTTNYDGKGQDRVLFVKKFSLLDK
ncbi:GNAT family N-acetyltransferase [Paenibacillus agilis]|uniref:GNAT family N-acetyltransferase n=1 Tax=Paenibacillus agilis TaxID=3020863 RepID=A0A559J0W0_9BACL|nr:GNAT family N-acetyltransferase [Paenibacillus agilis]TVX93524.1 GNAT family N-acetyltransferase [Paenibacillus agilis]